MKQTCPCCSRPYDDEWVVYCPVSRDLAEKLRGDGLTTNYRVNMKLQADDVIVVTELHNDGVARREAGGLGSDPVSSEGGPWGSIPRNTGGTESEATDV